MKFLKLTMTQPIERQGSKLLKLPEGLCFEGTLYLPIPIFLSGTRILGVGTVLESILCTISQPFFPAQLWSLRGPEKRPGTLSNLVLPGISGGTSHP
jgi:hypothetical protein